MPIVNKYAKLKGNSEAHFNSHVPFMSKITVFFILKKTQKSIFSQLTQLCYLDLKTELVEFGYTFESFKILSFKWQEEIFRNYKREMLTICSNSICFEKKQKIIELSFGITCENKFDISWMQ